MLKIILIIITSLFILTGIISTVLCYAIYLSRNPWLHNHKKEEKNEQRKDVPDTGDET